VKRLAFSALVAVLAAGRAGAADLPVKAPAPTVTNWTGFYLSSHFGYAAGRDRWQASEPGAGSVGAAGSFDLFQAYKPFDGSGSYFIGLGAGYNTMLSSRVVLGVEADVSFPNTIRGTQSFASPGSGTASFAEAVELSGTARGKLGYAPGPWMIYATGGLAWTYDRFTRMQIGGTTASGILAPGDQEDRIMVPRVGYAAGAGAELKLPGNWSVWGLYLYEDFGTRSVTFPLAGQTFDSRLAMQSVRAGFNYKLGENGIDPEVFTKGLSALDLDWFNLHGQATFLQQYAPSFREPYRGQNSLYGNQGRETADLTFYAGFRLWKGAELWINPEIDQGFGLSSTLGVAGFPSGEAYKIGASVPYAKVPRTFLRQTIDLGGDQQKVDADLNKFAGTQTANRLVITVGKFSVGDVFDNNKYAHDPRVDFMNWSLIDTATFDYAADAFGYTYGGAVEWYQGNWTLRVGLFDLPTMPNSSELDPAFRQLQWIGEVEHRHELWGQPGKIAVTGFLTRANLGRFDDATALALSTATPADITAVRRYTSRSGVSVNIEQQLMPDVGFFARAGIANGAIEPDAFTDVDRTVAAGISLNGHMWGRNDDTFGLAGVVNGITASHQAFLNAGGLGILVGDGRLPNPAPEKIIETYYAFPLLSWRATLDYQFIIDPGYNADRGPVSVISARLRTQF